MRNVHVLNIAKIMHRDIDGNILWQDENLKNTLHDGGEMFILAKSFATGMTTYGGTHSALYLGLDDRATLAEADTLTSLSNEPSTGNGYARVSLSTAGTGLSGQDFYINQPAAFYRADSKSVTFTCSTTGWSQVRNLFLCSASSGTSGILICSVALSTARTLAVGDSLQASIYIGLSE